MRASESTLRNGDCFNCMVSARRSVPSNAGSPVVFAKSASTIAP